jgi:hypothetical protein
MSRMAIALVLAALSQPGFAAEENDAEAVMTRYQLATAVDPHCRQSVAADQILVCGRRNADRYRVPLIEHKAGDPRIEGLPGERVRLQHITTPCQDHGPFLIGCGAVGVQASIGFDGKGPQFRKLAP